MKIIVVLLALSSTLTAAAQDGARNVPDGPYLTPETLPYWQKHAVRVDRRVSPQEIPYGYAMEAFFMRLDGASGISEDEFARDLRAVIPATNGDVQKIRATARETMTVAGIVRNAAIQRPQQLCAEMVAAQRDTPSTLRHGSTR